jgi:hypothetical protein
MAPMAEKEDKRESDDEDEAAAKEAEPKDDEAETPADKVEEEAAKGASSKEDDEDDEEEDEPKPAAKPQPVAAKPQPVAAKPQPKSAAGAKRPGAPAKPGAKKGAPAKKGGSPVKAMVLFVVIVGGLGLLMWALSGGEGGGDGPVTPKWAVGTTVDVEITLVPTDSKDLACAAADELGGRHCAFESQAKAWSKGDNSDDKKLLKPYTTTDRIQFLAAGLWSDPALAPGKLPATRFSVKCKYAVEGKMKKPSVRWASDGPWYDSNEWYSGAVSSCALVP